MAGRVSKEVIDRIRHSLDIADVIGSYIQIKRIGQSAKALCPFHKEKTPSFSINLPRQAFHCFGCGAGGDVFEFVMRHEGVDFPTALRLLASRAGVVLDFDESDGRKGSRTGPAKDELFKVNEEACKRFHQELLHSPGAEEARAYLKSRQLDADVWKEWGIGYAPEGWNFLSRGGGSRESPDLQALEAAGLLSASEKGNLYDRFRGRVMFTIRDELGRVVGFSGRILKPDEKTGGKYVNTPETILFRKSRILFGLDKAKRDILDRRTALLCEGQIDCIRCHLAGFRNAVAAQGTAFTEEHAHTLKRYADLVVIVLDSDSAGRKAALRTAELLMEEGLAASLVALPVGEDPDSLILKGGADAFSSLLDSAVSPMLFLIGILQQGLDLRSQEGLLRATRAVIDLATHAQGAVQEEQMLREAAAGLHVGFDALRQDLRRSLRQKYRSGPAASASAPAVAAPPVQAHPVEESELVALLCSQGDPVLTSFVRDWLPYPLLTDPVCETILHALVEEEGDLMAALDEESAECRAFAAQMANAPPKLVGRDPEQGALKAAQDFVTRLWRRHLEKIRMDLGREMKKAEGEKRERLLLSYSEMLIDLGLLKRGWEDAQSVITRHLDRMAMGL